MFLAEFREIDGNEMISGVPDEKTKHVADLVKNQKTEDFHPKKVKPLDTFTARPSQFLKLRMVPREIQANVDRIMSENPLVSIRCTTIV